jgi:hypothetical protein
MHPRIAIIALGLATACAAASGQRPGDGSQLDVGTGSYVRHETFNAMPTGAAPGVPWITAATAGAVTVREVPFAADKSVEVRTTAGSGSASLSTTFADQRGRVVFEAKVLARETAGFKAIPYVYDRTGSSVASVAFHDGNIEAHVGGTTTAIEPFAANVWYRVRIVVDTDHDTFDLFVDGVRKAQDQPLRSATDAVDQVRYYVDGATAGTLLVDDVIVYREAAYIGAPPAPVFDPRSFGARGDGATSDQAAIQQAIDAAASTGGSVVLTDGRFLSGTLTLRSHMTFYVDASATLLGSTSAADYPAQAPATGNTQLSNTQRALLYAPGVSQLKLDGGGTIDGQGNASSGAESTRPLLIWTVLSDHVTIRNLYLTRGAVWSLVSMESDHVVIDNVNVQSSNITHDGIDVVDGTDITVHHVAVRSGDDAMCLKSGVRRGIDTMTVSDSMFSGDSGGSNGIKFGTATYGAFKNITIADSYVKDVQYAAMAVESRQGADVAGVTFQRIELANTGAAFFVYLAQQATTHPIGDAPKLGSIDRLAFTDITGSTASWPHSPHQGSLITGHVFNGATYPITNLSFTNVAITFDSGLTSVPASPAEAQPDQYPESNMFGDLPAWGYYLRHVSGVAFTSCTSRAASADARAKLVTDDVTGLVGSP